MGSEEVAALKDEVRSLREKVEAQEKRIDSQAKQMAEMQAVLTRLVQTDAPETLAEPGKPRASAK